MHEMALVRDVIGVTLNEAERAGANKVNTIYLKIGKGRDVVVDLFSGLFSHLAKDTIAESAELVFERIPMITKCNKCGQPYHLNVHDKSSWACPRCHSLEYSLYSGMEFIIDRIELS